MGCTTALLLIDSKDPDKPHKVKVITQPNIVKGQPLGIAVDWFQCDEKWIPNGLLGTSLRDETEEGFHKDIRKNALESDTFVAAESTNPELNYFE